MSEFTIQLPNGNDFWLRADVTGDQATGLLILVITSIISALAVITLLTSIALSAWNTRKWANPNMFVRSHAAAYLTSLLVCDLCQAVGSLMNAKWYMDHAVVFQPFCVAQGAIKQISDVGTAVWSFTIAMHTFWVLFLRWDLRRVVMIATLFSHWAIIGTLVIAGPATLKMNINGPFFAISGYWCWISDQYPVARITLDYMFMFASAILSAILYMLVYLKLRGNILVNGWRIRFRFRCNTDSTNGIAADSHAITVAKQMLIYPVAYTIIILPIAACRFAEWSGHEVPFAATIFSDCVYLLSGLVNVSLFFLTRRVLPRHSVITKQFRTDSVRESTFDFVDDPRTPSFMAEKMDIDRENESVLQTETMFKRVDSPDADLEYYDERTVTSLPMRPEPVAVPGLAEIRPLRLPAMRASRASTPTTPRMYPDGTFYNSNSADRVAFPASATGSLAYPQSPLSREFVRSPGTAPFSGSAGSMSPVSR